MKKPTITKSIAVKFKTFDYSSADIFVSMTSELEETDDVKEAGTELVQMLLEEVKEIKGIMDNLNPQIYAKPETI